MDSNMKIDLHVHASERSSCARSTEEAQIRAAIKAGLDAIVFTDHWRFVPVDHLNKLNEKFAPFKIFGGIEVTTEHLEDCIVIGARDAMLEKSGFSYADLHAVVRKHKGFMALVHPFRYHSDIQVDIEQFKPDAIEVRSHNTPVAAEKQIREIAMRLNIPTLCDSDSHSADAFGKYYNVLSQVANDETELIALLQSGTIGCGM